MQRVKLEPPDDTASEGGDAGGDDEKIDDKDSAADENKGDEKLAIDACIVCGGRRGLHHAYRAVCEQRHENKIHKKHGAVPRAKCTVCGWRIVARIERKEQLTDPKRFRAAQATWSAGVSRRAHATMKMSSALVSRHGHDVMNASSQHVYKKT